MSIDMGISGHYFATHLRRNIMSITRVIYLHDFPISRSPGEDIKMKLMLISGYVHHENCYHCEDVMASQPTLPKVPPTNEALLRAY